jgi:tetratricopeptide (TPR) repeat protein
MTYPGNPALPPDIQGRIQTTYRQSLQSAAAGNREEALLGCDFILRLDPQFAGARTLQQKLNSGAAPDAFRDLLAALDHPDAGVPASGLRAHVTELLGERRFAEVLNAAERDKRAVAADPELARLVEQAQALYEAEPYVAKFTQAAENAIAFGQVEEARGLLDKARALDPGHPRLAELEARLGGGTAPGADAGLELPDVDLSLDSLPPADEAGRAAGASAGSGLERPAEETSGRIVELMREGQAAFDRGEYQAAIDAWSRIFLIDIDHEDAARKIERARQLKAEREREVEEIFHEGVGKFDAGDLAGARAALDRVLELAPGYALAREYLEKIDEREAGGSGAGPGLPELVPIVPPAAPASGAARAQPETVRRRSGEVQPAAEMPAREIPRRAVGSGTAARARRPSGPSPRFLAIGGAVLLLLAGGGWYVFSRWDKLFPNAQAEAPPAAARADVIAKAQALHDAGKTAEALALLHHVPPEDPNRADAVSLAAQWEKLAGPAGGGLDPQVVARRRALLESAQTAVAAGENFRARRLFRLAAELAPLDGDWVAMATTAEERLKPLAQELQLYKDGDFEYLVQQLWRRREADPNNRDVARMIIDAYYDLGVLDLQRGDPTAAREKFREARGIDSTDAELNRLERFAAAYEDKSQDLLYRIFVKYVPMR